VSRSRGREGESFISPADQRTRIDDLCERMSIRLLGCREEIDVSGGTPLAERSGLRENVEDIEAGRAEVLIVGYFDRLARGLRVQEEVLGRVEAAGGEVLAVDYGRVSQETAAQWLSGTIMGAFFEYYRRAATERGADAQADAVARGVVPFPNVPPGLALDGDSRVVHTAELPVVIEAFEMRDEEATIKEIRHFLQNHGINRSYHGVQHMLGNRLYLGEIHFGELVNLHAHEPAVDRALFERVQTRRVGRGRRAKSDRLLARLGVLRCGSCGARMIVGMQRQNGREYPFYRCPPNGDCTQRVTISAVMAERVVVEATKERIKGEEGQASAEHDAQADADAADVAQANLDAAIRAFSGLEEEPTAIERLGELRALRDEAVARWEHSRHLHSTLAVTVADWDRFSLSAKRALIRTTVKEATVSKGGKGSGRIAVKLLGE
jgi:site-specific DNA recombinase